MRFFRKRGNFRHLLWAIAIGIIFPVLLILISDFHLLKVWELKTYDLRMVHTRAHHFKPQNVVMFYVDEPSLRYMDGLGVSWPWPRELYASALDFSRRGGARAVIFDLFYSEDSVYGVDDDRAFAKGTLIGPPAYFVLFLSKNEAPSDPREAKILAKSKIKFEGEIDPRFPVERSLTSLPILPLVDAATGFGNAQVAPDIDGVYRRVNLLSRLGDAVVPYIALKVVSDLNGVSNISWNKKDGLIFGNSRIPLDDDGRLMLNYYGGVDTFPAYSLAEVLVSDTDLKEGKRPAIDPNVVKGKIVMIGVAAPGLYDTKATPFSRVFPGAEVNATVIENLMTEDFIRPMPNAAAYALTVACGLLAAICLAWTATSWGVALWLIILVGLLGGSGFFLFTRGVWMPLVVPFGALGSSAFTMVIFNFLTEGRKKREIRKAFGQYLSPHVVSEIARDPDSLRLGGSEQEITIFFSDIADFTTISEKTPPPDLVLRLNQYFSDTTRIIQKYNGTLDKYIGDAIMAFWGAPLKSSDHAASAVYAALEIQKLSGDGQLFMTRIGIHTGPAVVGNIGSDIRFNYTAIGDTVNLASRLEGLNKEFGTKLIISETTYKGAKDGLEARRIGRVKVKGRSEIIGIFEPLGLRGDFGRLGKVAYASFEEALALFESARFKEAEAIFGRLALEANDLASKSYKNLCRKYIDNLPENFDGVITFTTK